MAESPLCIAVIADIVRSRQLSDVDRADLQERLKAFLDAFNQRHAAAILARFVITAGDEFQGLLLTAAPIADFLWDCEQTIPATVRIGIGRGSLSTSLQQYAVGMDGPAWHRARQAILDAKKEHKLGGVFAGFESEDPVLNALARLLRQFRDGLRDTQRVTLARLREGERQSSLVGDVALTKQAIHGRVKRVHWPVYREGESGLRALLARHDYSAAWPSR